MRWQDKGRLSAVVAGAQRFVSRGIILIHKSAGPPFIEGLSTIYVALSGLTSRATYDSQGVALGYPITPLRGYNAKSPLTSEDLPFGANINA